LTYLTMNVVRREWSIRHQTPFYNLFIDKKESVM